MLVEKRFYWLKDKGLWLAVALTALMISPVLYWNATHDWISFLYQLNHGQHHDQWDWLRAVNTQLAQLGVYSLALFVIGLWLMVSSWFLAHRENVRLLAAFALPIILLFALNSGYEMSLPHWTQLAWLFISRPWCIGCGDAGNTKPLVCSFTSVPPLRWPHLALNSQLAIPWMPFPANEIRCGNCTAGHRPSPWRKAFKRPTAAAIVRGQLVTSQSHRLVCLSATGVRDRQPFRPIRSLVWQSAGRFRGFIAGTVL